MSYDDNLCILIHGPYGVGKSWLGQSAPAPRLTLDAEGGSRRPRRITPDGTVLRVPKVDWNPLRDEPPEADGSWESCHVAVRDWKTFERAYQWLNEYEHPFRSVIVDSLTEIQKRCKDLLHTQTTGSEQADGFSERQWGLLLTKMERQVRDLRDLMFHPTRPLQAVVILAASDERKKKMKPALQGGLGVSLPGYVDLEGYLGAYPSDDDEDVLERRLLIQPLPEFEAKDRTHVLSAHYGLAIPNPNITTMLDVYNSEEIATSA